MLPFSILLLFLLALAALVRRSAKAACRAAPARRIAIGGASLLIVVGALGCAGQGPSSRGGGAPDGTAIRVDGVDIALKITADETGSRAVLQQFLDTLRANVDAKRWQGTDFLLRLSAEDRLIEVQAKNGAWTWSSSGGWWKMDLRVITDDDWSDSGDRVRIVGTHVYGPPQASSQTYDAEDAGTKIRQRLQEAIEAAVEASGGKMTAP